MRVKGNYSNIQIYTKSLNKKKRLGTKKVGIKKPFGTPYIVILQKDNNNNNNNFFLKPCVSLFFGNCIVVNDELLRPTSACAGSE